MFVAPLILQTQAPVTPTSATQAQIDFKSLYNKAEYMIPMRDGTKLYTQVYTPKAGGSKPILMERTPYGAGPAGPDTYRRARGSRQLVEDGFIFAYQDVRGKGRSEGDFENVRPLRKSPKRLEIDEATDTYDTVDFLVKNVPGNNQRVGLWGISYPGFYAGAGAVRNHPALRAVSPQAPVAEWFLGDDVHHNGAFFIQESFDFNVGFDVPRGGTAPVIDREGKSAYDFYLGIGALANFETKLLKGKIPYWNEFIAHDTYDAYWKDRSLVRNFKNVGCAVLTVGGWFDKEDLYGALALYKASERQNKGITNSLVMGPWTHGQWAGPNGAGLADQDWGGNTSVKFQDEIEYPFFKQNLDPDPRARYKGTPEATVFETGANTWHELSAWPPRSRPTPLLFSGEALTMGRAARGERTFVADPANPTPYLADWKTSRRAPGDWLIHDQRFLDGRPDVISYTSPPLTGDLRIGGAILADITLKTTGTDGDLVVKVIDVSPEDSTEVSPRTKASMAGYEMMLRSDIFRMRFRDSFERPKGLVPGKPTRIRFAMNDTLHTFKRGHRIKVQIQPYWFPIADRNPNQFMPIHLAKDADYIKADVTVIAGGTNPSRVVLPVLPAASR